MSSSKANKLMFSHSYSHVGAVLHKSKDSILPNRQLSIVNYVVKFTFSYTVL